MPRRHREADPRRRGRASSSAWSTGPTILESIAGAESADDRRRLPDRRPSPTRRRRDEPLSVVLGLAAAIAYLVFRDQWTLPHDDDAPLFRTLNGVQRCGRRQNRTVRRADPGQASPALVGVFDEILASLGWPGVIGVAGALGARLRRRAAGAARRCSVSRRWAPSGCGTRASTTLGMMLAAVVIALAIGLPLGILAGRSNRVSGDPLADPRRDADHADVRLPGADHPAVPDRRDAVDDRDADLRDAGRDPDHLARHPRRVPDDRRGGPRRSARPSARSCARSSCRSPAGRSAWRSTRRSCSASRWSSSPASSARRGWASTLTQAPEQGRRRGGLRRRPRDRHPGDRPRPPDRRRRRMDRPAGPGARSAGRQIGAAIGCCRAGDPRRRPRRAGSSCDATARSRTHSRSRSAARSTPFTRLVHERLPRAHRWRQERRRPSA